MVPQNEHDFSQYSWPQALIGLSKLAVIMIFPLSAIFMIIIALSGICLRQKVTSLPTRIAWLVQWKSSRVNLRRVCGIGGALIGQ